MKGLSWSIVIINVEAASTTTTTIITTSGAPVTEKVETVQTRPTKIGKQTESPTTGKRKIIG